MQQLTITIPKRYNDGTAISPGKRTRIESDLLNFFSGFTRIDVYGAWGDDYGEIFTDDSYRYEILTEKSTAYWELQLYAKDLCQDLDQKCILTTHQNIDADFVEK